MNTTQYTVIGAGHGGKAMAAHLALMDFRVTLFNRTPERAAPPTKPQPTSNPIQTDRCYKPCYNRLDALPAQNCTRIQRREVGYEGSEA